MRGAPRLLITASPEATSANPTDFLEDVRLEGNLISETEGGLVGTSQEDIKSGRGKDRR